MSRLQFRAVAVWHTVGVLRWQSCDNSYNFSQIITIVAQMKRKNRYGTPLEKSNTIFLYFSKLLTNFFFPEPAAWPGASQDWIGSPTLGTGNFGKKIRRYFFHHCFKKYICWKNCIIALEVFFTSLCHRFSSLSLEKTKYLFNNSSLKID